MKYPGTKPGGTMGAIATPFERDKKQYSRFTNSFEHKQQQNASAPFQNLILSFYSLHHAFIRSVETAILRETAKTAPSPYLTTSGYVPGNT